MKQWFKDLFSDSSSVSMIRVLSLICVLTASGVAIHAVSIGANLDSVSVLCGVFLGAGISGKVSQKILENKAAASEK